MAGIGGKKAASGTGGGGARTWLQLDWTGESQIVEAGKHDVMRRTGLSGLDLRILDPLLSYPSMLLGRERAIVVHLDHIKAIIMVGQVLLLNHRDPNVVPFLEELRQRIMQHHQATKLLGEQSLFSDMLEKNSSDQHGPKLLPFEFVVLETCLMVACNCFDKQATALEEEAYPALDQITSTISPLNLEGVHKIKSRLAELTQRVQKVRDELERVLSNDDCMAKIYLTNKDVPRRGRQSGNSSLSSIHNEVVQRVLNERVYAEISMEKGKEKTTLLKVDLHPAEQQQEENVQECYGSFRAASSLSRRSQGTLASVKCTGKNKHLDVKELEVILEAYFVQVDASLNGLSTLREYVDDTEDYINIILDDKRNNMMKMTMLFMTAGLVLMAFTTVSAVFSMNIHDFSLYQKSDPPNYYFLLFCGGGTTCSVILYLIAIFFYKRMGLLG